MRLIASIHVDDAEANIGPDITRDQTRFKDASIDKRPFTARMTVVGHSQANAWEYELSIASAGLAAKATPTSEAMEKSISLHLRRQPRAS